MPGQLFAEFVMMLFNHRYEMMLLYYRYEVIKGNRYKGLPLSYVQRFSKQVRNIICGVISGVNLI